MLDARRRRGPGHLGQARHRHARGARGHRRAHPAAQGDADAPLKALVFDSFYDSYQGVVVYVRVIDGRVRPGTQILLMSNGKTYEVQQVGVFRPTCGRSRSSRAGAGRLPHRGDQAGGRRQDRRHGHRRRSGRPPSRCPATATPSRWSSPGSIPIEDTEYEDLRDALEKLRLNDSGLQLRAGDVARPGLRLPLRLPRHAAHGDRAGAAGARVQPLAHHHRADVQLPHDTTAGEIARDRQPVEAAARRTGSSRSRSPTCAARSSCRPSS